MNLNLGLNSRIKLIMQTIDSVTCPFLVMELKWKRKERIMKCTYENCIVDVGIQLKKAVQSKNNGYVCIKWFKRNTCRYIE